MEHSAGEYGAVERSPVYVQFSNAGALLTNLAIEERLGVASVSVAPIVPRAISRLVRTIMTNDAGIALSENPAVVSGSLDRIGSNVVVR